MAHDRRQRVGERIEPEGEEGAQGDVARQENTRRDAGADRCPEERKHEHRGTARKVPGRLHEAGRARLADEPGRVERDRRIEHIVGGHGVSTSITRPRPWIKNAQAVGIAGATGEMLASPPSGMRPTRRSSDVGLTEYRRKRRFAVTSEPSGDEKPRRKRPRTLAFVVQKHRASRLHYDFRLEWNGLL